MNSKCWRTDGRSIYCNLKQAVVKDIVEREPSAVFDAFQTGSHFHKFHFVCTSPIDMWCKIPAENTE